ncbi:hypothetical protein [Alsobacter metallidurans]|nr:hypothetical protein [Alsobacter metallidurans]
MVLVVWAVATIVFAAKSEALFGVRNLDSDDVMRLVQVRDLLGGQGWFDLVQHRVAPDGLIMHWSRIVDLGIASLILFFGTVFPPDLAERAAGALWPTLLLGPALVAVAAIAERLGGRRAMPLGVILFCLIGPAGAQFYPGRIDHHNVQLLACLVTAAAMLRLDGGRAGGVVAGLGAAVMLSVGIETLPVLVVLCAAVGLLLAGDPVRYRAGAMAFGLWIALGSVALTALTIPSAQIAAAHCDAISAPYLAAAIVGGLGLAGMALLGAGFPAIGRWITLAAVGAAVAAAVAFFGPACLRGPVSEIDPRLLPIWLNGVQEMEPLWPAFARGDRLAVGSVGYLGLGLVAVVLAWRFADARRRNALALVATLQAVAFLVALGQIRGVYYANAFAAPLIAAGVVALQGMLRVPSGHRNALTLAAIIVISSCSFIAKAITPDPAQASSRPASAAADSSGLLGCAEPATYKAIRNVAPGVVLAGIDLGPFLLASSPTHSVLGAPYHRNVDGILASYTLLSAGVDKAEALLRARGVVAVVMCGPVPNVRAPGSLARALENDVVPPWLSAIETGTAARLFVLR